MIKIMPAIVCTSLVLLSSAATQAASVESYLIAINDADTWFDEVAVEMQNYIDLGGAVSYPDTVTVDQLLRPQGLATYFVIRRDPGETIDFDLTQAFQTYGSNDELDLYDFFDDPFPDRYNDLDALYHRGIFLGSDGLLGSADDVEFTGVVPDVDVVISVGVLLATNPDLTPVELEDLRDYFNNQTPFEIGAGITLFPGHGWGGGNSTTLTVVPVPEPTSFATAVIGSGLIMLRRRRS